MTQKKALRRQMLQKRERLTQEYCLEAAQKLCQHLIQLPIYQQAETVMFYMSIRNEVDLHAAIDHAWQEGKRVFLPRVKNDWIEAVQIDHWQQLQRGVYQIREPDQKLPASQLDQIDLVLVPGVAFDLAGYRLGYGGGYYDRLFTRLPDLVRMGIAYPTQIVSTVYPEQHDRSLSYLLTSEHLYTIKKEGEKT